MNQERSSPRWYTEDGSWDVTFQQRLAGLPLPDSALVIDVRSPSNYTYPLLWNLATDIEDLATQMRLQGIPQWEYLETCIDFLQVDTEETRGQHSIRLESRSDTMTFESIAALAAKVNDKHIQRVFSNRNNAPHMRNDNSSGERTGPQQSAVRVFFLIDMKKDAGISFQHAVQYAQALKDHVRAEYDPQRIGHDEPISIYAVCMNADLNRREPLFERYSQFKRAFDIMILIQEHRDDGTQLYNEYQAYAVEQILYGLLLASPGEIADEQNTIDDEDLGQHLMRYEEEEAAFSCIIYSIGISSIAYSARWGQRWISYGLTTKLIDLIEDTQEAANSETLLKEPGKEQSWLDEWQDRALAVLPGTLPVLLPELADAFQRPTFADAPALGKTLEYLQHLPQQTEQWYGAAAQLEFTDAIEQIAHLPELIANSVRERNKRSREVRTPADDALYATVALQDQAQSCVVSLFRGARGGLPRALLQLDMLSAKLREWEKGAQIVPPFKSYQQQFEQEVEAVYKELRPAFYTWRVPPFGMALRSTALIWLVALALALIVAGGVAGVFIPAWQQLTAPLLPPLPAAFALRLLLIVLIVIGMLIALRRRNGQLHKQSDAALRRLRSCSNKQREQLQALVIKRVALHLLMAAGIYDTSSAGCVYKKRLQELETALKQARDEADRQRERADEYRKSSLQATYTGREMPDDSPWLRLNTNRDYLPWDRVSKAYQDMFHRFEENDPYFDELVRRMLQQAAPELPKFSQFSANQTLGLASTIDDQEELQLLASSLVAAIISAKVNGYNLVQVEPQIQRYQALQARSLEEQTLLAESITLLEQAVAELQLEQIIIGEDQHLDTDNSFFLRRNRTPEQILAAWVSHACQFNEPVRLMLEEHSITERLEAEHIVPDQAIKDLLNRFQLFGNHSRSRGSEHYYLLLIPGVASKGFFDSLDRIQLPHFQWVRFPDGEKLIYMHVHRTRL